MREVLIENSALSVALHDPALMSDLIGVVVHQDVRLVISPHSADEVFAHRSTEYVREHARGLLRLFTETAGRVGVTLATLELWRQEASGVLAAAPFDGRDWGRYFLEAARSGRFDHDFTGGIARVVEKQKRRAERTHVEARPETRMAIKTTEQVREIVDALQRYRPEDIPDWLVERWLRHIGRPDSDLALVKTDRSRYRSLRAGLALLHFGMFANAIPPARRSAIESQKIRKALDPRWGDDYDIAVAASAAYCETFIVNDAGLRGRCEMLRPGGCVEFESVTMEAFLNGAKREAESG